MKTRSDEEKRDGATSDQNLGSGEEGKNTLRKRSVGLSVFSFLFLSDCRGFCPAFLLLLCSLASRLSLTNKIDVFRVSAFPHFFRLSFSIFPVS